MHHLDEKQCCLPLLTLRGEFTMPCNHLCYWRYTLFQPKQVSCVFFTSLIWLERCGYSHILPHDHWLPVPWNESYGNSYHSNNWWLPVINSTITTSFCCPTLGLFPGTPAIPPGGPCPWAMDWWVAARANGARVAKLTSNVHFLLLNCQHTVDFSGFEGLLQEWDQLHLIILQCEFLNNSFSGSPCQDLIV